MIFIVRIMNIIRIIIIIMFGIVFVFLFMLSTTVALVNVIN